jgi:hypothetical protein
VGADVFDELAAEAFRPKGPNRVADARRNLGGTLRGRFSDESDNRQCRSDEEAMMIVAI